MSINLPRPLIFGLSFLFILVLYWPSLSGTPIWDDVYFWFSDPVMKSDFSYLQIIKNFAWPVSVVVQKFMLEVLHKKYTVYHVVNLFLHVMNSLLVYRLGRIFRLKNPIFLYLLFLLHPVCVISVAWMIQIKTLLCFFFAASSLLSFMRGLKQRPWMVLSWFLFGLSVYSKSASLFLVIPFFFMTFRQCKWKALPWVLPFFIIAGFNASRLLSSEATIEATRKIKVAKVNFENLPSETSSLQTKKAVTGTKPVSAVDLPLPATVGSPDPVEKTSFTPDLSLMLKTSHYYFWQTIIPMDLAPVKGLNFEPIKFQDWLQALFLVLLVAIFWNKKPLAFLAGGYFMLIPFLGIVLAPFMTVTWVSDQHLYLVLPLFMGFWLTVSERITWKHNWVIVLAFISLFSFQTWKTNTFYRNQVSFYKASLSSNPINVPISYNLAFNLVMEGKFKEALVIIDNLIQLAEFEPHIKRNIYYPFVIILHQQLQNSTGPTNGR